MINFFFNKNKFLLNSKVVSVYRKKEELKNSTIEEA